MAFNINIEAEHYISDLLCQVLSQKFPDAYIHNRIDESNQLSTFTVLITDNEYIEEDLPNNVVAVIPLSKGKDNRLIDVPGIFRKINEVRISSGNTSSDIPNGLIEGAKTRCLISFAMPEEREDFIKTHFEDLMSPDFICIRLNYFGGILANLLSDEAVEEGVMTKLVSNAGHFADSKQLLEYLNPDSNGFMTPGPTDTVDDLLTLPYEELIIPINHLINLSRNEGDSFKGLIVIDGIKLTDTINLASVTDEIHVLVSSKQTIKYTNYQRFINSLGESVNYTKSISFHIYEELHEQHL